MKFRHIILLLFMPLSLVCGADGVFVRDVQSRWQSFQKNAQVVDLGPVIIQKSIYLHFGESANESDDIRKVEILSSKLQKKTLQITIAFTDTIYGLVELLEVEAEDQVEVIRHVKLDELRADEDYTVELYSVQRIKTTKGKDLATADKKKPRLFAKMKFLSEKSWLLEMKKKHQAENLPKPEFKKFLETKIAQVDVSAKDYKSLVGSLKKITSSNGFDFIFFPGKQNLQKPVMVSETKGRYVSKSQDFQLSFKNISFQELLLRVAVIGDLKYKIGPQEIVLASGDTFKKSEAVTDKNKVKLAGLKIDVKNKKVTLEAKISISSGILEYLMCLPNSFEHESIFVTEVKPAQLHMGLLLIGSEPLPFKGRAQAMKKLKGNTSRLKIDVTWEEKGKTFSIPLNKLLVDREGKEKNDLAKDSWFFAGSYFTEENVYAANLHMSIISLQQHPASVIHYGEESFDPHKLARGGFEVNENLCPPYGATVKLIFSIYKK